MTKHAVKGRPKQASRQSAQSRRLGDHGSSRTDRPIHASTIQRAQLDPSRLTPGDVLALQRTVGNHVVQRMMAPKISSAPTATIQRGLNWTPKMLSKNTSTTAKINHLVGDTSTFTLLRGVLAQYQKAQRPSEELPLLERMDELAGLWLANHKDKSTKASVVKFLRSDVQKEIPKVKARIAADAKEQEAYIRKVESKGFKFLTASGFEIAKSMKNWHAGKKNDKDDTRAAPVHQLTKKYGLTYAEASAIAIYSASDYQYINPAVAQDEKWLVSKNNKGLSRIGRPNYANANLNTDLKKQITPQHIQTAMQEGKLHSKIILSGVNKLPDWRGTVYRGMGVTKEEIDQTYAVGKSTVDTAFASTSTNRGEAELFAMREGDRPKERVLLRRQLTKGKDIQLLAHVRKEEEILALPGATYQTKKISVEKKGMRNIYVIDQVQVK